MLVMMTTATFVVMMLMLVMVAAAALMVMMLMLVMMTAAALMIVVFVLMVVTAAAFVVMVFVLMVVTAAATVFPMFMVVFFGLPASGGSGIPRVDLHIALNGAGDSDQLRNQRIRVRRSEPQLLGGKGDDSLFHIGVGIEFRFNLGSAVGAVQIVDDVYLARHTNSSLH